MTLAWRSSEDKLGRSVERAGCQAHLWESLRAVVSNLQSGRRCWQQEGGREESCRPSSGNAIATADNRNRMPLGPGWRRHGLRQVRGTEMRSPWLRLRTVCGQGEGASEPLRQRFAGSEGSAGTLAVGGGAEEEAW